MVLTSLTSKKDKATPFVSLEHCPDYCKYAFSLDVNMKDVHTLIEAKLLPLFQSGEDKFILIYDLISLIPVLSHISTTDELEYIGSNLFSRGIPGTITPCPNTQIHLSNKDLQIAPNFYAAVRNLISFASSSESTSLEKRNISYFPPTRVTTSSQAVNLFVEKQLERAENVASSNASQFAKSAYYMGSKLNLVGFLVEAISSVLPEYGIAVDLMCGSGAASGAFSKMWRTIASDAQKFCRTLAVVQGGGFSISKAANLLGQLLPNARKHASELYAQIGNFLDWEDKIFHSDFGADLIGEYRKFVEKFPTYPHGVSYMGWDPIQEVEKRKSDPKLYPYCLFTAYFANVFLGLRQCVEVDSLRFAIEYIENKQEKQWALGALIAAISERSTTYAGHFAQPPIKGVADFNLKNLPAILERRTFSIIHEFSIRLLNLAEESEKSSHVVELVPGPWEKALLTLDTIINDEPVVVYLDAPYKREEYSRYYHVLETLISYAYPSSVGKGRIPDKNKKERFDSEFFTRSESQFIQAYVRVICDILKRGWACAWSYSDSGDADIVAVLNQVYNSVQFDGWSYATPYEHKPQGGRRPKKVTEYLILLIPKRNQAHYSTLIRQPESLVIKGK
jgi:adenine-specific DNA-methyltransferase